MVVLATTATAFEGFTERITPPCTITLTSGPPTMAATRPEKLELHLRDVRTTTSWLTSRLNDQQLAIESTFVNYERIMTAFQCEQMRQIKQDRLLFVRLMLTSMVLPLPTHWTSPMSVWT